VPLNLKKACKWEWDTAFDLIQLSLESKRGNKISVKANWRPPVQERLKINADAAFSMLEEHGATGVVIQDDQGFVRRGSGEEICGCAECVYS
jgi:hypothetical protein